MTTTFTSPKRSTRGFTKLALVLLLLCLMLGAVAMAAWFQGSPPAAPSNLALAPQTLTSIRVTWADNSSNETGFQVFRSTDGVNFSSVKTTSANAVAWVNSNLTTGTTYYYKVKAKGNGTTIPDSDFSNTVSIRLDTPAAPSNLFAEILGLSGFRMTWQDNSDNETAFEVEEKINSGGIRP
jgi:titin